MRDIAEITSTEQFMARLGIERNNKKASEMANPGSGVQRSYYVGTYIAFCDAGSSQDAYWEDRYKSECP